MSEWKTIAISHVEKVISLIQEGKKHISLFEDTCEVCQYLVRNGSVMKFFPGYCVCPAKEKCLSFVKLIHKWRSTPSNPETTKAVINLLNKHIAELKTMRV